MTTRTSEPSAWSISGLSLDRSHRGLDFEGLQENRTWSDDDQRVVWSGRAPSEAGALPHGFDREWFLIAAARFRPSVSVHPWT
ncbi:hypothetical protein [Sphingomonas sp. PP-CC-3G-468]|uniref:hypothetical protein n=1 Tax=Sphingomonas sp. PP-CC-3G-468 TaxID=2135656 RepID=UPI001046C5A9|nr:hypothetical protein [Sphingomonas sp. PP-CC-3G-468]TCM07357.1 hypothetical protein C8J41_103265 [Sphingomonas sp. PP-CC-3G-468]